MGWASFSSPLSSARLARLLPGVLTRALIGGKLNPQSAGETALGLVPVDYAQPSDTSLVRSSRYTAGAAWDYRSDQRLFEMYLSKYGAVFNGVADDTVAIADAINAMQALGSASGPRRVFMPAAGLTALINTAGLINFYCGAVGIDFNGMILNASGITAGTVITATGRGSAPYSRYASSAPVENFNLVGPSSDAATTVMLSLDGGTPQNGEIQGGFIRNCSIHGGSVGVDILANVYICKFDNLRVGSQTLYGVRFTGGANTGENINFHGGSIANVNNAAGTGIGLYLTPAAADADLNFFGTSFDYNNQLIEQQGGRLTLTGCHLELGVIGTITSVAKLVNVEDNTATAFQTALRMLGGIIYLSGAYNPTQAIVTAAKGPKASVLLDGVIVENYAATAPLVLVTDASAVAVRTPNCTLLQSANGTISPPINAVYNGGFETGNLNGWTKGSAAVFTVQSGVVHSGTYALEITEAAATSGDYYQIIPVRPGQRVYTDVWLNVTSYTAGDVTVSIGFAQDAALVTTLPGVTAASESAATAGWVESQAAAIVPDGANFMTVSIGIGGFTGTAYVDDIAVAVL